MDSTRLNLECIKSILPKMHYGLGLFDFELLYFTPFPLNISWGKHQLILRGHHSKSGAYCLELCGITNDRASCRGLCCSFFSWWQVFRDLPSRCLSKCLLVQFCKFWEKLNNSPLSLVDPPYLRARADMWLAWCSWSKCLLSASPTSLLLSHKLRLYQLQFFYYQNLGCWVL